MPPFLPPVCRLKKPSVMGISGYTQGVRLSARPETKTRPRRIGRDLPARPPSAAAGPLPLKRGANVSGGSKPTTRVPVSFPSGPRKRSVGTPWTFHFSRSAAAPSGGPRRCGVGRTAVARGRATGATARRGNRGAEEVRVLRRRFGPRLRDFDRERRRQLGGRQALVVVARLIRDHGRQAYAGPEPPSRPRCRARGRPLFPRRRPEADRRTRTSSPCASGTSRPRTRGPAPA